MVVRDTDAMIAGMAPRAVPGAVVFACLPEGAALAALPDARALIREDEGVTLILPAGHPAAGEAGPEMVQITLDVPSALDGVGLTAAVAAALAERGIPANVVAACHHDHVYVPADRAAEAVEILRARAAAAPQD